jgi:hypothetical protein
MIGGSNAAGEPIPPHFQFQTAAQTDDAEAIRIECMRYMLDVVGTFGHDEEKQFPISFGMNNKGGMDDDEFFEYLQKSIMKLYPDAAPVKGKWVVIKCDSGPGRLNGKLLTYLRFHGFILFPGVPNTTAVTQETDQNYGPFQGACRTNLQLLIDERIHQEKSTSLSPWIVGLVVFGGMDPETGLIVRSAFQEGFSEEQNISAWMKVGAIPLSRKCLQSRKVRRSIGDGDDEQKDVALLVQEHNTIACSALCLAGYNGFAMKMTIKPDKSTKVITVPHTQERIELLSEAKTHGQIFAATGGDHLTSNDIFKGLTLKNRKKLRVKLLKEKTLRQRQERSESSALAILARTGNDHTQLKVSDLTVLLTWHQVPKVASMKKEEKKNAWLRIVESRKVPPPFEKWTVADDLLLEEAQSNIVEMAHTHLGHMEALKKKELLLAARAMSQKEFDELVADRYASISETIFESIVNSTTSDAPPENELAVESHHDSNATIDPPLTLEDEGAV